MGNELSCNKILNTKTTQIFTTSELQRAKPINYIEESQIQIQIDNSGSESELEYNNNKNNNSSVEYSLKDIKLSQSDMSLYQKEKNRKNKCYIHSFFSKEKNNMKNLLQSNKKYFEEKFREKLFKSIHSEEFPNSELIHLDELMIPFPEDNDFDKTNCNDYLKKCIEEIKLKVKGKYLINKSQVYETTRKEAIGYLINSSNNDNYKNSNDDSFYLEDNKYIGINFKNIKDDTYVIYFLYAVKAY